MHPVLVDAPDDTLCLGRAQILVLDGRADDDAEAARDFGTEALGGAADGAVLGDDGDGRAVPLVPVGEHARDDRLRRTDVFRPQNSPRPLDVGLVDACLDPAVEVLREVRGGWFDVHGVDDRIGDDDVTVERVEQRELPHLAQAVQRRGTDVDARHSSAAVSASSSRSDSWSWVVRFRSRATSSHSAIEQSAIWAASAAETSPDWYRSTATRTRNVSSPSARAFRIVVDRSSESRAA